MGFGICLLALGTQAGVSEGQTGAGACKRAVVEGEVQAGQGFERTLGNGIKMMLEPLASGWILRVLPANGPRGQHDYAELATPPYQSVSPLLIGTDWSFRAQDAVAWNPRRFHFAADAASFARLSAAYREYSRTPAPTAAAQAELAALAAKTPEGVLEILDSRIVPGTADQAGTAAMVASHFATTAHSVDQPKDGKATPLGQVVWIRFRLGFDLPAGFVVERGVPVERRACP
jgi:hypothetical protein